MCEAGFSLARGEKGRGDGGRDKREAREEEEEAAH